MKFSELAAYCESIDIDCDRCKHKNECSLMTTYTERLSPYDISKMVKDDREF